MVVSFNNICFIFGTQKIYEKMNLRLKFCFSFLFFSLIVSRSFGQSATTDQPGNNQEASMEDLQVRPIRLPALQEVGGSPFLSNDYNLGSVHLSNEKTVSNVPVKFNIFNNAVMVQKDGEELKLESFDLVSYNETGNNGVVKQIMLKKGYPEIDNHTDQSIYQVLAVGTKVHLLKYMSQKVEDAPTLGDYSRREIVTTQQLFIYLPGGEIKKIKTGKQAITDALPGMSAKIDELIKNSNLNLKNEADLAILVDGLNK
jgi:hypothetical protein